jgi:hypothetical protein
LRPGLVVEQFERPSGLRLRISPATIFDKVDLDEIDLSTNQKCYFIPIKPNCKDPLHRPPLVTGPIQPRNDGFQCLYSMFISAERAETSHHAIFSVPKARWMSSKHSWHPGHQRPSISHSFPGYPPRVPLRRQVHQPRDSPSHIPLIHHTVEIAKGRAG